MTETVQSIKQPRATTGGWYEFATRHRASIAAAVVLVFPLLMPFTALAVNILIYGLYALGFNLVFGYLGLLSFGHAALFGTGAYLCGIAIVHLGWPWYAAIAAGVAGGLLMALVVGVLGSFTTVSSFSLQTLALLRDGEYGRACGNVAGSLLGCLAAVSAGYLLTLHAGSRG